MILRDYQQSAVDELAAKAIKLLGMPENRLKLVFKAPTGAGKTVMMAAWLKRMAHELPGHLELQQRRYAYIWIAPNQLHQQSLLKLKAFFEDTREVRCLQWEDLGTMALQEKDVLFFNWQSISQEENLIVRDSETNRNLDRLLEGTRQSGVEIVLVLDEAHMFATKGAKALQLLDRIQAKFEVDVSATPMLRDEHERVTVSRHDVVKAEMIKERVDLNPAVTDKGEGTALNEYLLGEAYRKKNYLAKLYHAVGSLVRPLLLVQLPSDNVADSAEDRRIRDMVEQWLSTKQVTVANGKLAVWLSKEKKNLEGIESDESPVEVLLFKQAVAMGWDCPRAAVLVIFREIKSQSFTIQTVGRILRMPEQKHYPEGELNLGYVYTNLSRDKIEVVADDGDYLVEHKSRRIKAYGSLGIQSAHIEKRVTRNRLGSRFRKVLRDYLKSQGWKTAEEDLNYLESNRAMLWNWSLSAAKIEISIPKDVNLTGSVQSIGARTIKFAKTPMELDTLLHYFCQSMVGEFAKVDSTPILKMALLMVMEEFLGLDELAATKVILCRENGIYLQAILEVAFELYRRGEQERAARVIRTPEYRDWDVPLVRLFPDGSFAPKPTQRHVMKAYFELKGASGPEQRFALFLEAHSRHLRWWYKNGDAGREHFAVPYENIHGQWSLFYVDFILLLSDGSVAFFDTKMIDSDGNASRKHNGLLKYLEELRQKYPERRFLGGVLIEDKHQWRFSRHRLEDNFTSLDGWDFFDPKSQSEWPDFREEDYVVEQDVSDPQPQPSQADFLVDIGYTRLTIHQSRYDSFDAMSVTGKLDDITHVVLRPDGSIRCIKKRKGDWGEWHELDARLTSVAARFMGATRVTPENLIEQLEASVQQGFRTVHSGTHITVEHADDADFQKNNRVLLQFDTHMASAKSGLFASIMELT